MCLKINPEVETQVKKQLAKNGQILCYRVYEIRQINDPKPEVGFVSLNRKSFLTKEKTTIVSNRAQKIDPEILILEETLGIVKYGIHAFLKEIDAIRISLGCVSGIVLPVVGKKEDFIHAGYLNDFHNIYMNAVFTQMTLTPKAHTIIKKISSDNPFFYINSLL